MHFWACIAALWFKILKYPGMATHLLAMTLAHKKLWVHRVHQITVTSINFSKKGHSLWFWKKTPYLCPYSTPSATRIVPHYRVYKTAYLLIVYTVTKPFVQRKYYTIYCDTGTRTKQNRYRNRTDIYHKYKIQMKTTARPTFRPHPYYTCTCFNRNGHSTMTALWFTLWHQMYHFAWVQNHNYNRYLLLDCAVCSHLGLQLALLFCNILNFVRCVERVV